MIAMNLKLIRYSLAAMLMPAYVLLWSCSSTGQDDMDDIDSKDLVKINISVDITVGHNVDSRSGVRPLDSSDPAQRVNNMRVYLFRAALDADPSDNSAFHYCRVPHSGNTEPADYFYVPAFEKDDTWNDSGNETHAFLIDPYLEKGYQYKLLAIGRDDIDESSNNAGLMRPTTNGSEGWIDISENPAEATTLAEAAMSINIAGVRLHTCELFTGCTEAIVVDGESENFTAGIFLRRAVAGVIMYIENIPTHFKALADFSRPGVIPPYSPLPLITKGKEYKVSSVAIAPICISSCVGIVDRLSVGDIPANTNFRGYYADRSLAAAQEADGHFINTNTGNSEHPNSIFVGNFVLPVDAPGSLEVFDNYSNLDHTLYLVFYTTDNDMDDHTFATPFFWYPIESVSQSYDAITDTYIDDADATPVNSYPLKANHVYSLGEKYGTVDAPIDLSALQQPVAPSRSSQVYPLKLRQIATH